MTNEEYYEYLDPYITELELCVENTQGLAKTVIGSNLIQSDICFIAMMDRSVDLAKGMTYMLKERNLTCSGSLLRLQIDNCLRLYAINIAENEDAVVNAVINDGKISDHRKEPVPGTVRGM